jgi:phenylacetate-CoA ligase
MGKFWEKVYHKSPSFVQDIGVTLYGLKIYRREYGREFRRKLYECEKNQWLSREELRAYQDENLRKLIRHCFENVPYYRLLMDQRRLKPSDIKTVDDLPKLPVLTPAEIRVNFDRLVASNYKRSRLILGHTSGTTGSPLEFYYDRNICLIKNVFDWRQKRWAGIDTHDKIAFFLGRIVVPMERRSPPFWRTNHVLNHLFMSSFHLSAENLVHYLRRLRRFKPMAVEGYPSTLFIIARFLLSQNETLPVKAAFTSSETLYPQQRETIEQAFECPLFDFYGMAERTIFATECDRHRGHHLNMDFGVTEIIKKDNQPAEVGEPGRIVATSLHNYAMPLIRYRTSDITAIRNEECPCGRKFPLMEDITTKAEDIITTPDGRYISSSILTHPFKPMHNILESQIIQEDIDTLVIKIVKTSSYNESDTERLLKEMKRRLGDGMDISIRFVDSIERTSAGKFRWVISRVPLDF